MVIPVGLFALASLQYGWSSQLSLVLGGLTAGLVIATVAVADGQAWGALLIALYGVAVAVRLGLALVEVPYTTTADYIVVAFHAAISVLTISIAFGLVRAHAMRHQP